MLLLVRSSSPALRRPQAEKAPAPWRRIPILSLMSRIAREKPGAARRYGRSTRARVPGCPVARFRAGLILAICAVKSRRAGIQAHGFGVKPRW